MAAPTLTAEVASLAERMAYLTALRVAMAAMAAGLAVVAPESVGGGGGLLATVIAYVLISILMEGLRRLRGDRGLMLVAAMLLIDGVFLAAVMYLTGGTGSPSRFLVYLHLIAVTLLGSYRSGLKIALWHSLVAFVMIYAQAARLIPQLETTLALTRSSPLHRPTVQNVTIFWLIAIGTAAFSAVNERELRRRKSDLEAVAGLATELERATEPAEVGQILLDWLAEVTAFRRALLLAAPDGSPTLLAHTGVDRPAAMWQEPDSLVWRAWAEHRTLMARRIPAESNPMLTALLPEAANVMVVPLAAEGRPVGVLVLEYSGGVAFRLERRVVTIVEQLASYGTLALANAWLMEQVKRSADTDSLTGISNRRLFDLTLEREVAVSDRTGAPLSLLMVDVDRFKQFNDSYGHQAGDQVLRSIADAITRACRESDLPARFGGEEFAVILPACSTKDARTVAQRVKHEIAAISAQEPITASVGIATFPPHGARSGDLVRAADGALYRAKRAGRNAVRSARPPRSPSAAPASPMPSRRRQDAARQKRSA